MIEIDGKPIPTVVDAAANFSVSVRAIYHWIRKGVIPPPPTIKYGSRTIMIYPDHYLSEAKEYIKAYRRDFRNIIDKKGDQNRTYLSIHV